MLKCKCPRHFSAAEVLENNRATAFRKIHALCRHSERADRMLRQPTWPTGYEVIQNGRPDMKSYIMSERILYYPKWRTGCDVIQDGDPM